MARSFEIIFIVEVENPKNDMAINDDVKLALLNEFDHTIPECSLKCT